MKKIFSVIVILAMFFSISTPSYAASGEWLGTTNSTWATTTNWNPNTTPGTGNTATFDTAGNAHTTIDLGAGVTINTVAFNTGAASYTIGSGAVGSQTLTLNDNGAITSSGTAASQTVNANLVLGTDTTSQSNNITNNTSNALTVAGNISGSAAGTATDTLVNNGSGTTAITGNITNGASTVAVTQSGTGTLTLSGTNTYSGGTTISSGTLVATTSASSLGSNTVTMSGGTLDLYNNSSLAYGNNVNVTSNSSINADTVVAGAGVTQTLGTLGIASGDTLNVGLANTASSGTDGLSLGAVTLAGPATINTAKGAGGANALLTLASIAGSGDALTIEGTVNTTVTGVVNLSTLTIGTGGNTSVITLDGASTISTLSFGSADTLDLNNNLTGLVDFNNSNGTVNVGSGDSISGGVQNSTGTANKGTLNFLGSTTINGGNLGSSTANEGLLAVNFEGGSSTLANNIYATTTTLSNNALLTTSGGQRTISGALDLTGTSILNIGTTNLITGAYAQGSGTSLDFTANSSGNGYITASSPSTVNSASIINATVQRYIATGTILTLINGAGGVTGSANTVNTIETGTATYAPRVLFTDSDSGGNNILTANRATTGFASLANNPNAQALGVVLDNETSPSTDMNNVLNTLEFASNAQTTAALNTLGPVVDRGVFDTSMSSVNNFMGASVARVQSVASMASIGNSGVSTGDENPLNGLWAKQYGGYINQGTRDGIVGYNAWNTGTAVGLDHLLANNITVGASLGYAYGNIHADENSASTFSNSAEATIYAGYQGESHPYFIDAAGTFANNWYNGERSINVVNINRTADSRYQGQQSSIYLDGGYKFDVGHSVVLTPITSLQWTHLALGSYSESNAGDLNLMVNRQSYNVLESGLGASISSELKYDWVNITPEFHAKWLYDFINDDMVVTSAFTGGGASFTSRGASPARNAADIGGSLTFDLKNDVSLIAGIDTEVKDNFMGVYGSISLRYKF